MADRRGGGRRGTCQRHPLGARPGLRWDTSRLATTRRIVRCVTRDAFVGASNELPLRSGAQALPDEEDRDADRDDGGAGDGGARVVDEDVEDDGEADEGEDEGDEGVERGL